jgi:hypothetical protein
MLTERYREVLSPLADRQEVGEGLARMLEIGQSVHDRDRRRRREGLEPLLLEGPHGDAVEVAREDAAGVLDRLAATELELRAPLLIRAMWLVHVREDGSVAYRALGAGKLTGESGRVVARTPVEFSGTTERAGKRPVDDEDAHPGLETLVDGYAAGNLAKLRGEMRKQLIADGLFPDEAEAMLKTWELAYFKSPGLRVFYLLPQQWTDAVLPLSCSLLADVSRTMIGRVELVTPKQRALLKKIGSGAVSKINWFYESLQGKSTRNEMMAQLWEGKARFQDLDIPVPPDYRSYIDLGRFRNALILDEHTRRPNSGIGRFVEAYNLEYYTPDDEGVEKKTARND